MHRVENNSKSLIITKIRNFANNKQKKKRSANLLLLTDVYTNISGQSIKVRKQIKSINANASDYTDSKQFPPRTFAVSSPFQNIDINFVVLLGSSPEWDFANINSNKLGIQNYDK